MFRTILIICCLYVAFSSTSVAASCSPPFECWTPQSLAHHKAQLHMQAEADRALMAAIRKGARSTGCGVYVDCGWHRLHWKRVYYYYY